MRSLRAFGDLVLDRLPDFERFKGDFLDLGAVEEHIPPFSADEAEPLARNQFLDGSLPSAPPPGKTIKRRKKSLDRLLVYHRSGGKKNEVLGAGCGKIRWHMGGKYVLAVGLLPVMLKHNLRNNPPGRRQAADKHRGVAAAGQREAQHELFPPGVFLVGIQAVFQLSRKEHGRPAPLGKEAVAGEIHLQLPRAQAHLPQHPLDQRLDGAFLQPGAGGGQRKVTGYPASPAARRPGDDRPAASVRQSPSRRGPPAGRTPRARPPKCGSKGDSGRPPGRAAATRPAPGGNRRGNRRNGRPSGPARRRPLRSRGPAPAPWCTPPSRPNAPAQSCVVPARGRGRGESARPGPATARARNSPHSRPRRRTRPSRPASRTADRRNSWVALLRRARSSSRRNASPWAEVRSRSTMRNALAVISAEV